MARIRPGTRKSTKKTVKRVRPTKRGASKKVQLVAGEHVRIVPLHYPKPVYSAADLSAQQPMADGDLYDGKPHLAAASGQLTYRGGPLLQQVQVYSVYWGASWQSSASAPPLVGKIDQFFRDILVGS